MTAFRSAIENLWRVIGASRNIFLRYNLSSVKYFLNFANVQRSPYAPHVLHVMPLESQVGELDKEAVCENLR